MKARAAYIFLLLVAGSAPVAAQTAAPADPTAAPVYAEVPGGFRGFKLGMDLETVKAQLLNDPYFAYRGDPDVSFLPITEQPLIECEGTSFIKKGYFQFHEERLYIIILVLDPVKIDYFTMYQTLSAKYGPSTSLDPTEVVWEFAEIRLSLERPLNVKYIATEVFDRLQAASQVEEDFSALSRARFLEQF